MKMLIISLKMFLFFSILTGIIYPLFITGVAQIVFPVKSNGSLVMKNKSAVGSTLIGQQFDSIIYFTSRPSATSYNPLPSGGSNYSLTSIKLKDVVNQRKKQFISLNHLDSLDNIPSEMVFASASGLDPHISPKSALMQVERIAGARHFNSFQKEQLIQCIRNHMEAPQFLCLGEERVNVLLLNLSLNTIR